jgi:hypothetical protein
MNEGGKKEEGERRWNYEVRMLKDDEGDREEGERRRNYEVYKRMREVKGKRAKGEGIMRFIKG